MAQVVMFLVVVLVVAVTFSFASTFVVPFVALYVLIRGWSKAGGISKAIAIVVPIVSIIILLVTMGGDADISFWSPFVSLAIVAVAYFRERVGR